MVLAESVAPQAEAQPISLTDAPGVLLLAQSAIEECVTSLSRFAQQLETARSSGPSTSTTPLAASPDIFAAIRLLHGAEKAGPIQPPPERFIPLNTAACRLETLLKDLIGSARAYVSLSFAREQEAALLAAQSEKRIWEAYICNKSPASYSSRDILGLILRQRLTHDETHILQGNMTGADFLNCSSLGEVQSLIGCQTTDEAAHFKLTLHTLDERQQLIAPYEPTPLLRIKPEPL